MRRQSNMIFICCSKKTDFSRSGRKIKFLKWEKVRKTWCSGGALCGLWPGEHWRANQWHWWLDPMAERPQTYSQWWICQFRCCPAPTEYVLRIFLKVKLNIWSPSISSASFGRLLLRDCRSEMIHIKHCFKCLEMKPFRGLAAFFVCTLRWEQQHIFVRLFWKYILEDHILVERWVRGWTF